MCDVKFFKMTTPVAQKDYQCEWCPEPILQGERHVYQSYQESGVFDFVRWHQECFTVFQKHCDELNKQGGSIDRFDDDKSHNRKRGSTELIEVSA